MRNLKNSKRKTTYKETLIRLIAKFLSEQRGQRQLDNIIEVPMEKTVDYEFYVREKITINIINPRFYYWFLVGDRFIIATTHMLTFLNFWNV